MSLSSPARAESRPGLRGAEAAAFRQAVALLEEARRGGHAARAAAILTTGLLWDAVLLASADPASALPPPLRRELASLARNVLKEVNGPAPDLDFLITVNGQVLSGLAVWH
jgi:flagellar biosynthesis regulator FlaF